MSDGAAPAIRRLLAALIRAALPQNEGDAEPARAEARRCHAAVREALAASADPTTIKLDGLWTAAAREAETPDLNDIPLRVSQQVTAACPFSLADLSGPTLDLPALEERIRASAATG